MAKQYKNIVSLMTLLKLKGHLHCLSLAIIIVICNYVHEHVGLWPAISIFMTSVFMLYVDGRLAAWTRVTMLLPTLAVGL